MIGNILLAAIYAMFRPVPAVLDVSIPQGNCYLPHQGKRECARRVRQMRAGILQPRA